MSYQAYKHCFGEANYHLQLTPKYRRVVFKDEIIKRDCEASLRRIAEQMGVELAAIEFGPEHAHLFLCHCHRYSVSQLVQHLKGASSYELRTKHARHLREMRLGDSFWSDGYFFESVGRITSERIRYYIERQQGKHWQENREACQAPRKQSSLDEYN